MTDPIVTAVEVAAIPTAIASLKALQQFESDIGPDPLKWVATVGPAKLKLLGTLGLLLPQLAVGEGGALEGIVSTTTSAWITKLEAVQAAAAPAA